MNKYVFLGVSYAFSFILAFIGMGVFYYNHIHSQAPTFLNAYVYFLLISAVACVSHLIGRVVRQLRS